MIRISIADTSVIVRDGLKSILSAEQDFVMESEFEKLEDLIFSLEKKVPDVLIIDPCSFGMNAQELSGILNSASGMRVLAVTNMISKMELSAFLDSGVCSYLLKECDREEIYSAVRSTRIGERFLCGKIVNVLLSAENTKPEVSSYGKRVPCDGMNVTEREAEIIKYIAAGYSNKQIADKLFLSAHTVGTHRKNIMSKLRVNNTAGVVMFAVKNQLLTEEFFN